MNIPLSLFTSDNFQKLLFNCNDNKNTNNSIFENNLQFHQNLAKKLLKYSSNNKNFQVSLFNWLSSLKKEELIKVFCIDSKWLIDIIHQLLYMSLVNSKNPKFKFRKPLGNYKDSFRLGMSTNSMCLNSFFNLQGKYKIKETGFVSKFSNYFEDIDRNYNLDEILLINQEKEFLKNIKYLSIDINNDNNYNNIITLSYSLISNFPELKKFLLFFSNREFGKNYIEIISSSPINGIGNKIFYNYSLPKWLSNKETFSLAELLTGYFEQIVILNYEYYNLYNKELLPYPYKEKLNGVIDNYEKFCLFILNYKENKMQFFSQLNFQNIFDEIKTDENINDLIQKRNENNRWIYRYFESSLNHYKNKISKSMRFQVNDSMEILRLSLFKDDINIFLEKMFFIDDKIAFTVEDFVYKKVILQINSLYSQQIANDLINDNFFTEEKINNKKKRKKNKKKKKEEKSNEKKEELKINDNNKKENNIEKENNVETIIINNSKCKKEKKKKEFFLFPTNQKVKKEKEENEEIKEQIESDTQQSAASNSTENTININSQQNNLKENSIISSSNSDSDNYPIFQNENNKKKNKNFIFYNSQNKRFQTSYSFHSSRNNNKYNNVNYNPLSFIIGEINQFTNEIKKNTLIVNKNKELLFKYRKLYIDKIESLIFNSLKQMNIQFNIIKYGSFISGLSIESSDIDLMIKIYDNNNLRNIMFYLVEIFESDNNKDIINIINPIYSASVPVIKLECFIWKIIKDEEIKHYFKNYPFDKREIKRLKFDISFFETNSLIKLPSENILDYIKENILKYPYLIDIIYILKRYMLKEGLNESYKGGISSYSLFLLILSYLKSNKVNVNISLGYLLIEILTFYSNFTFYNHIIFPGRDDYIFQLNKNENFGNLIDIRDPITELNVAKSSFRVSDIQYSFAKAANYLVNHLSSFIKNHNDCKFTNILSGLFI